MSNPSPAAGAGAPPIPVCAPLLDGNEERYVTEALRGGWISSAGPWITRFEQGFAHWCGRAHGVATTSGTTALHLALRALGVGPGDEVILPDFTMVACLFAVLQTGATPVFVDAEPDTWNLDPRLLEAALTPRTKAIMPVHLYGHPCAMDEILAFAARHGLLVLEDAAEAHGAEYRGRRCGGFGDASAFSFFANKILATGEGGMVVTSDERLAERCRYYRNLCFPLAGPRDFVHDDLGYNYRMASLQAALGVAQLERAEELVERRRANARRYLERLREVPGLQLPAERAGVRNVYWMFGLLVDHAVYGLDRDALMRALAAEGIETRPFFKPMHSQGVLARQGIGPRGEFPVTERLAREGLYLPSGSGLRADEAERVCNALVRLGGRR